MISRTAFCSAQAAVMRLARTGPMPSTSRSRSGVASIMSKHLLAERAQQLPGVGRPDAPDHSGRQVLLNAVGRCRGRCAQEPRLELLAVCSIVDPFAGRRDPLTGCDGCSVTNNGYDITMPARLGPQHAKAILDVMVRDALDETGENFLRLILGRVFHTLNSRDAGPKVCSVHQRNG
jgi:hypothetical protein